MKTGGSFIDGCCNLRKQFLYSNERVSEGQTGLSGVKLRINFIVTVHDDSQLVLSHYYCSMK